MQSVTILPAGTDREAKDGGAGNSNRFLFKSDDRYAGIPFAEYTQPEIFDVFQFFQVLMDRILERSGASPMYDTNLRQVRQIGVI